MAFKKALETNDNNMRKALFFGPSAPTPTLSELLERLKNSKGVAPFDGFCQWDKNVCPKCGYLF